ncbi:MAG: hypothetical protein HY900_08480 [Deltaproteobacteria bacterium]|nr:hypothetical protein [Deltaproteobacteria bacterium]
MDRPPKRVLFALALGVVPLTACGELRPVVPPPSQPRLSGGTTTGPVSIRRVELSFADGRPLANVPRNSRVGARAVVQFNGTGPFRASWLVDGRPVELVSTMVSFGDTLTFDTAPATVLPTFEPGAHEVSLRVEQPATTLPSPQIRYFVTVDEAPTHAKP